jgi:hypothetical protein
MNLFGASRHPFSVKASYLSFGVVLDSPGWRRPRLVAMIGTATRSNFRSRTEQSGFVFANRWAFAGKIALAASRVGRGHQKALAHSNLIMSRK